MADASGLVDSPEQNGDELQSPLSSLQDALDSNPATEPAEQAPEMQEMSSPGLDNSEADAEVLVNDEAIANVDLSTSEGANSSPPPTTTPNSPPDLESTEEGTKEEGKPEEKQEEAEEEAIVEERQEEIKKEAKIEERKEEHEEEAKTEERKEKAEEEGRSEGLKEDVGKSEAKKENEWLDVLGSGQLLKKTLRVGGGVSTRPTPQCQVRMKVKGSLPSGASIDRSNSLSFIVGDGDVIQAIDIAASLMEKGEVCSVKADPRFAYGTTGRSPDVPPNTSVMYELELLDVKEPLDLSSISLKDLLAQLNKKRGRGNDLFQRKEFDLAVNSYSRAVQLMRNYREEQHISELSGELRDLWIRCLNNLAAAQLKVEQYNEALESVEAVLTTEPENVKALYRCGKVHLIKGNLDLAVEFLSKAANLSTEKAIHAELQRAMRKRDQHREKEKAMYRRMMEGVAQQPKQAGRAASKLTVTNPSQTNWGWGRLLLGAGIAAVVAAGIAWLAYRYRKVPN